MCPILPGTILSFVPGNQIKPGLIMSGFKFERVFEFADRLSPLVSDNILHKP